MRSITRNNSGAPIHIAIQPYGIVAETIDQTVLIIPNIEDTIESGGVIPDIRQGYVTEAGIQSIVSYAEKAESHTPRSSL
jgi:hypothetical protein